MDEALEFTLGWMGQRVTRPIAEELQPTAANAALFAIQGDHIIAEPLTVARIALALLAYFAGMWILGSSSAGPWTSATNAPQRWRSTTSSWRSPSPSASGAPAAARRSPASSDR
jgi:hypothetical protein